jgi:hypothetical protein
LAGSALAEPHSKWGYSVYPLIASEKPRPFSPAQVKRAVDNWLSCYECGQGELRRVVAAGEPAIPLLEAVGNSGEDPALRERLLHSFSNILEYAAGRGMSFDGFTAEEYAESKLAQHKKLQQSRAKRAIEAIQGTTAPPDLEHGVED